MRRDAKIVAWSAAVFGTLGVVAGGVGAGLLLPSPNVQHSAGGEAAGGPGQPTAADLAARNVRLAADLSTQAHRRATEDRLTIRVMGSAARFTNYSGGETYAGSPVERDRFMALLPTLLDELDRYPTPGVASIGLRRVIICTAFVVRGKPEGGTIDRASGTIYLSADWYDAGAVRFRQTLHHEMFHLIDAASGTLGADDPQWSAANPPGFHYGTGGFNASPDNTSNELASGTAGFLTAYSRSGIEEDKAEVYGWLMADPSVVRRRTRADAGLATKAERVRVLAAKLNPTLGLMLPPVGGPPPSPVRTAAPAPGPSASARR